MIIRAKAPLRVSFAGGGTDVPPFPQQEGGCVLSATIDRFAYGTLRSRPDPTISVSSLDYGLEAVYPPDADLIYDGKLDLVKAAIRRFGDAHISGASADVKRSGFDLFLHSDAPPGSGLGASSAMMVALVGLMKDYRSLPLTDYEVAEAAYVLERKELGISGGLQDQYAAAFGGFNFIEFLGDRVVVNPLRVSNDVINELHYNLLLCYTGTSRLSSGIIKDQVERYERAERQSLDALREIKHIAVEMKNMLLTGNLEEFGALLDEEWRQKKRLSPAISNDALDGLYELALKNGAIGGKITGAGGGGYLMLYCQFDRKHEVAEELRAGGCEIAAVGFEPHGLQTWRMSDVESV